MVVLLPAHFSIHSMYTGCPIHLTGTTPVLLPCAPCCCCSVEVQLVGDRKNTRVDQRILHLDVAAAALKLVGAAHACCAAILFCFLCSSPSLWTLPSCNCMLQQFFKIVHTASMTPPGSSCWDTVPLRKCAGTCMDVGLQAKVPHCF